MGPRVSPRQLATLAPVATLCLLLGCGDDSGPAADAGGVDAVAIVDSGPMPTAPALPNLLPCVEGFRELHDDVVPTCEPWPEGGAASCAGDELHVPGEPGCAPIGDPCPAGDLPEGLPADATVYYVLAGAVAGDGSSSAPFATIAEAMVVARSGDIIGVGRGTYDEVVRARGGVTLWGTCVGATTLRYDDASATEGIVTANRAGTVTVKNLRIGDSPRGGISIGRIADVVVDGVLVEDTTINGLLLVFGGLEVRRSAIRDVQAGSTNLGGNAVVAMSGRVDVRESVIERAHEIAIGSFGSRITLDHVAVRETQPRPMVDELGRAIQIQSGSMVTATASVMEGNHEIAILAAQEGTTLRLEDSIVRDTHGQRSDLLRGRGLDVQLGARAELVRTVFERNHDTAVFAGLSGAVIELTDAVVRDTMSRESDGWRGRAISGQEGGVARGSRVLILRNEELAVFAALTDGRVELDDVTIRDVRPRACIVDTCPDAGLGFGASGMLEGTVSLRRFWIDRPDLCGVQVAPEGAVDLVDGQVTNTEIGVCIQQDGYDVSRLTGGVRFRDNGTNLQATSLPLPDSTGG